MMPILTTASAITFLKMRATTATLSAKRMPSKSTSPRMTRSRWLPVVRAVSLTSMSLELPLSYPDLAAPSIAARLCLRGSLMARWSLLRRLPKTLSTSGRKTSIRATFRHIPALTCAVEWRHSISILQQASMVGTTPSLQSGTNPSSPCMRKAKLCTLGALMTF